MGEFWRLLRLESRALFGDSAILLTLFGGILFYALLYPLPYARQVPRELPLLLVDEDGSVLSRHLAFMADATPQLRILSQVSTLAEAQAKLQQGEGKGILLIPRHFYRDVRLGRTVTLAFAGDGAYYLIFGAVAEGLSSAAGTLGAQIRITQLLASGATIPGAEARWRSFTLNSQPLFNPTLGYQQYVVPAVFLVILHQTLLIAAALLGATQNESSLQGQAGYWQRAPLLPWLLARLGLLMLLYLGFSCLYFGPMLAWYGLNQLAAPAVLLLFLLPFFLAAAGLGIVLGALLTRRELATPIVLLSSLPLVFSAGFIWPVEALPGGLVVLVQLLPTSPGIQGLLRLEAMGADWPDLLPSWGQLWALALGYGLLAYACLRYRQRASITTR